MTKRPWCAASAAAASGKRRTGSRWTWGGVVLGAFELGLGTMLIMQRTLGLRGLVLVAAMWALVGGTLLLLDGMRLRRLARLSGDGARIDHGASPVTFGRSHP